MGEFAWIDCGNGRKVFRRLERREVKRSDLPSPYTRPDGMSAVINPLDGKPYESKSQYYETVKAHGCEIVGDDKGHWDAKPKEYKPEGVKETIKQAWDQLSG